MQVDLAELLNRGVELRRAGRHKESLQAFDQVLGDHPDHIGAINGRGATLGEMHRYGDAIVCFGRAVTLAPDFVEAWNNLGLCLGRLDRHEEALPNYERALSLRPDYLDALNNRSDSLFWLARYAEALDGYDRALSIDPGSVMALCNRGRILLIFGRFVEALDTYERALLLEPDLAEAWAGRASALVRLGRYGDSMASCDIALRIRPDFVDARQHEAQCRLRLGDFRGGLPGYEWRRKDKTLQLQLPQSTGEWWTGREDLRGKRILVRAEQGFGDIILFCRYIRLVAERGGKVAFEVPQALSGLMTRLAGLGELCVQGQAPPPVDYYTYLLSLPLAFDTELATIPADVPYLSADLERIRAWEERVPRGKGPRIGLVWSGNARQLDDCSRSIALARLAPIWSIERAQFVSLQKEVRPDDIGTLQTSSILDLSTELHDFADTAALISLMDLVITVDTSVAHLSGAMGRPTWVLVPFMPYWPWFLGRTDSPWYPTARLFRQAGVGEWDGTIRDAAGELAALSAP